ncbi:MAG: protein-export membrane protein SecD [Candidatus Ryanbacteria bacterium RIFCSPLOWO2_01_FULL_48_26]|uniref:Protein translocase subunit SecD n=1 Tax=Candidatus Ryanbacteria bacterium RIFCSPLOWO2_01_FULL_48_26 TaxID=1802126 RepID=A0A1G2GU78_9BACT|nr:MAG: protein-export membrane protein SecD [Candidatus Ryanbacteria bacterium RIFCSPLOWO2_01_FULL_48_26]OHB20119.1 MAG: protein-export membrane protein SecD [Parcubacteria group bacterium RIFCSPHIGHO2_02_FULL_48_10b]
MRKNPKFFLATIVVLAVVAAVFVYPKFWGANWLPWKLGLDLVGGSHLVYNIDLSKIAESDKDLVVGGIRDVIEKRVNLFGVSEPQVFTAKAGGDAQLVVELAGIKNISDAIKQIGETPQLDFREVEQNGSSTTFIPTNLTGRYVSGAQLTFDQTTGASQVAITFNDEGAKIFEEMTGRNVGKPIAIFLDNNLIEAPTVQQKISGGQAVITGSFSVSDARQLVERFNAGALPAPITLINQQTISPTLGADSLRKVIVAGAVGTLLVMVFMMMYYGMFGVFASFALLIYIALTLGLFKLIPLFTMSLAGLAGFVLTIGMAVDANVLIFERIKEELKRGLPKTGAVEEGFRRAWPSIRDSNISTIITAIILYLFTSSFVKGFALTLLIGVLVSLFSAITTTRLFLRIFIGGKTKSRKLEVKS